MPESFPCTGCGGCCRLIGNILKQDLSEAHPVFKYAIETFPFAADENGACEKLEGNKCSVYLDRPLLCNVDLLGSLIHPNKEEWYAKNAEACNTIIDSFGLEPSYKISEYDLIN